jgi:enamine deaminase RidA (YjgF/YER057c/UK114 family)
LKNLVITNSDNKSERVNYSSGSKWEEIVGYSRAVKAGSIIEVAGTTAVDDEGNIVGAGNPYAQTRFVLEKIEKTLKNAGSGLQDVVRTRMYVTDIEAWEQIGKAHGEFFGQIKPAATMVEVSKLISPDLLVEIEVTAIVGQL